MSSPVVVQGTPVSDPYGTPVAATTDVNDYNPNQGAWSKGEKQETKCRDPIFALLLYINVAAIAAVAAVYAPDAMKSDVSNTDYSAYLGVVAVTAVISFVFSGLALLVLMRIPEFLIKTALIFVVALSLLWAVLAFLTGNIIGGVIGLIFFLLGLCYARAVWSRIPFATINLITGCTAIRSNFGVTFFAYFFAMLAFGWTILWAVAMVGIVYSSSSCVENNKGDLVCDSPNYGILFVMFISYFFTHQVLQNSIHVMVAGVTGTWWFTPDEAKSCCSAGVRDSFFRTMTTSFGSICFGSLIVAIIRALQQLAHTAREQGDAGILACIAECILACIASIVEYINKWGFVYVGLYGYGYIEAAKNVFTLFKNRGWDAIIADSLVGDTLFLVSVIVGGVMGGIGVLLLKAPKWDDATEDGVGFALGFIVGLVMCSILMSTVASAVNAVIVLFAEAPAEFDRNYPDLSRRMRETWRGTYPGCI